MNYIPVDPVKDPADSPTITCLHPIFSVTNADDLRKGTIAQLRRAGVTRAVLIGSAEEIDRWKSQASDLFIAAIVPVSMTTDGLVQLRQLASSGGVQVFAELSPQYAGRRADDPEFEPFWSLAEQLDIPVGIHLGEGMPLVGKQASDRYRAALTSPFQLESVIKKHPRLRIYVMHAASPLTDEMIAMLATYPSLYVDISANDWGTPRAHFYAQLKRMVDAGFSQRIMFGSDQTIFPQAIALSIETIKLAPFLTPSQRRDILYNNAARFLRLTPAQIAADHKGK